jgi:hypothetical protein
MPVAMRRSVLCPTCITVFTEHAGNVARYSAKVVAWTGIHAANPARYSRRIASRPGSTGAREKPQWPTTSVVTPWWTMLSAVGVSGSVKSECVLMSMNPGATTSPRASITR